MMHIDYANECLAENIEQSKKWKWQKSGERVTIENFCHEPEFMKVALEIGTDKTKSIIKKIKSEADNRYFKITRLMRASIANDLLSKMSAQEIINKALIKVKEDDKNESEINLMNIYTGRVDTLKNWKADYYAQESTFSWEEWSDNLREVEFINGEWQEKGE